MELKLENKGLIGIVFIIMLAFFYMILGFAGMMSALGVILLFILPMYAIFDNFDLQQDEKIVFSFFAGVGVFPSMVYWLGTVISFRLAILVTFVLLVVLGAVLRKFWKK